MDTNPYGLASVWQQGDFVTRSVAILLLLMSVASWTVMITKAIQAWHHRNATARARQAFWQAVSLESGITLIGADSPFGLLAAAGAAAVKHHHACAGSLQNQLPITDWVTTSLRQVIDESAAKLSAGMAVLASVGSTAPFVGLFGTVWGIYHALISISNTGQASIDKVAGPVGEALIMTALGLAVAIPATFGYNALVRSNKTLLAHLNKFGFDLHALFVTGTRAGDAGNIGHKLTVIRSA